MQHTADRDQAIQWYRKAANQGNEAAKKNLQRLGTQ
jgi:TPR repeat protein